jgi:hypothetical protein
LSGCPGTENPDDVGRKPRPEMGKDDRHPKRRQEPKSAQDALLGSTLLRSALEKGRMPVASEGLAQRFCWQVSIFGDHERPGNPLIRFELHPFELIDSSGLPEGICDEIRHFANGVVSFKRESVEFVDPSTNKNYTPEIYRVAPLFSLEDVRSPSAMSKRVELVESRMSPRPRSISIRLEELERVLEKDGLCRFGKGGPDFARWAQALQPDDNRGSSSLLIGVAPDREKIKRAGNYRDGVYYVPNNSYHDQAGVLVWVDSQVIENLLSVVPLLLEDLDDTARAFYTPRDESGK